jgi:ferredoxin-NADP reductase
MPSPEAKANESGQRPGRVARVERIFDHNRYARSLFLAPIDGKPLKCIPGQFISISIPLTDETRTRPYTIASRPEAGSPYEICFNLVPGGRGAAWMYQRAVGDELRFTGPFGTFVMEPTAVGTETVFIAEGTAIAAIRPMIHRAVKAQPRPPITLLHGAISDQHLLYHAELKELARSHTALSYRPMVAAQAEIYERLRAEAERQWVSADSDRTRRFYICGIGAGVIVIRDLLRGAGYERRAVHYERW